MSEPKRVLVVDDDDAIRALLVTVLERRGLAVDTAANGAEALARCARRRYAVMLLDLMMPYLSGYDVLNVLKQMAPEERPIVIVLTAGLEPRDLDPALVASSMRKPFDVQLLAEMTVAAMATHRPTIAAPHRRKRRPSPAPGGRHGGHRC